MARRFVTMDSSGFMMNGPTDATQNSLTIREAEVRRLYESYTNSSGWFGRQALSYEEAKGQLVDMLHIKTRRELAIHFVEIIPASYDGQLPLIATLRSEWLDHYAQFVLRDLVETIYDYTWVFVPQFPIRWTSVEAAYVLGVDPATTRKAAAGGHVHEARKENRHFTINPPWVASEEAWRTWYENRQPTGRPKVKGQE